MEKVILCILSIAMITVISIYYYEVKTFNNTLDKINANFDRMECDIETINNQLNEMEAINNQIDSLLR